MKQNHVQVATIQEIRFNVLTNVDTPTHVIIREHWQQNNDGGLAFIMHKKHKIQNDETTNSSITNRHRCRTASDRNTFRKIRNTSGK